MTATWPGVLQLIFSLTVVATSTGEVLQEPNISDTTNVLLSKPELAEVQLELTVGTGLTLELQQQWTHCQMAFFC